MGPLVRCLALALVAVYLAAATTPCPAGARTDADAMRMAGPWVHSSHDHVAPGESQPAASAGDSVAREIAVAAAAAAESHWTARCLCGCDERPSVGSTPTGVGWAMVSRASAPLCVPCAGASVAAALLAPEAPARAPDHVPLQA